MKQMYIIGVDCAVQNEKTGLVLMSRSGGNRLLQAESASRSRPVLHILTEWLTPLEQENQHVLVCFDAPLGWPQQFGERLKHHRAGEDLACENDLFFRRRTDNVVHQILGKRPMDVTANFIARTAFQALHIIQSLHNQFPSMHMAWDPNQIDGIGFIESYPAAWLVSEGINHADYKKSSTVRQDIVDYIKNNMEIPFPLEQKLIESEHILDAALSGLGGFDFLDDKCIPPAQVHIEEETARKEGWIWIKLR